MKKTFRFLSLFVVWCIVMPFGDCVAARTAVKQNAIDVGTKVASATEMQSSSCIEKYTACMDAGCIIDNDSGGRCQCSNQFKELNNRFNKIRAKDYASEKLAKFGKEIIEMGDMADELLDKTADEDDAGVSDGQLVVPTGEYGESLRLNMHKLCIEQLSECKSQESLIKNLYSQKIKSDCAAFENSINEQNQKSKELRADAKKAVRGAALEQYQASNKYDLGQCVVEFGKCMQDKAECGADWTGCVGRLGIDKMYADTTKRVAVVGANSSVMIAKSTMEILESKKIICESVTKQCTSVKDQVWDAFLKNTIADIKIAESNAESDARSSCLTNISNCFLNACKDNIDENNPDSYDLCLTRPEAVKHLCKVELEPCLAATGGSYDNPSASSLWPSVLAKLAAMRVDACTAEVKECIQSEDRCGKDYSKCVGLDTNIIVRMCPYEKLVGCQKIYGKDETKGTEIYDALARIVDGVMLNIDNNLLQTCQNKVEDAMTKVCGDPESCAAFAVNDGVIGTQSLRYQICQYSTDSPESTKGFKWFDCRSDLNQISDYELGRDRYARAEMAGPITPFAGVISGIINWASIEIGDDGFIDIEGYLANYKKEYNIPEEEKARVRSELLSLQENINRTIDLIEKDQWVSFCVSGRQIPGVTDLFKDNKIRFPKLANTIRRQIATAAVQRAKANYFVLYDELSDRMATDLVKINERVSNNIRENGRDAAARAAQIACHDLAATSAFAKAPVGQSLWAKIFIGIIIIIVIVLVCVFTFGAATGGVAATAWAVAAGVAAALAAAAIVSTAVDYVEANEQSVNNAKEAEELRQKAAFANSDSHGEYVSMEWNYMEKITTDFDRDTMTCKRCIIARKCTNPKWHIFMDRTCGGWGKWEDPKCSELKF